MNTHTLNPGQRVRVFPSGETGTIGESTPSDAAITGFVAVILDGETKARPCSADNLVLINTKPIDPKAMVSRELISEIARRVTPAHQHRAMDITMKTEDEERAALREARKAGLWPLHS